MSPEAYFFLMLNFLVYSTHAERESEEAGEAEEAL